jgi:MFS family permease
MGLVSMALPLGGSVLTIVGQLIIESHGWRAAFTVFGIALLVLYFVPALLIIRRRPEDLGLLPDGAAALSDGAEATNVASRPETSWTLAQAVRTKTLWLLIVGLWLGVMANGAVSFHVVAYYSDQGLSATVAATALSAYGFTGAVANGMWGFLVERVSERLLAVIAMSLSGLCVLFLLTVSSTPQAFIFALAFGLAARGESSLVMMMVAQYYGRASYGTINGFITPFQMLGLGLGPLVASIFYDVLGSYEVAFLIFAASFGLSASCLGLARRPVLPAQLRPPLVQSSP